MALVFHSGFETGTFLEWASTTGSSAVSVAQKNTGAYSMRCNTDAETGYASVIFPSYSRVSSYIYIATAPGATTWILYGTSWNLALTTDRKVNLYEGVTVRVEGTTVLATDTWYRISMSRDSDAHVYYWIDGSPEGNYDGTGGAMAGLITGVSTAVTADLYFDDIVLDDTESVDDIGDIICAIVANPNAAGDTNAFDTAVPDVAHYLNYDDPAGALDDTTYVEESAKVALADIANLDSCADIGLAGTDVIDAVWCWARMYGDDTTSTAGMQVKDNGTAYNTIITFADNATLEWVDTYYPTMPDDAAAWTQARFNAFQVGGYHGGDSDNTRLSCVYVMVAYHAVAAGGWANIAKMNGVTAAAMGKVQGVAVASIGKVSGVAV